MVKAKRMKIIEANSKAKLNHKLNQSMCSDTNENSEDGAYSGYPDWTKDNYSPKNELLKEIFSPEELS